MGELAAKLPARGESAWLNLQLNHASKAYPRPWMWLLVALVALVWRRPAGWRVPVLLACSGLLVLLVTVLSVYAVPEYSVPVVPSFILLAAVAVFGPRAADSEPKQFPRERNDRRRLSAAKCRARPATARARGRAGLDHRLVGTRQHCSGAPRRNDRRGSGSQVPASEQGDDPSWLAHVLDGRLGRRFHLPQGRCRALCASV